VQAHPDQLIRGDADATKSGRDPVGALVERGVGQPLVTGDERQPARGGPGLRLERRRHGVRHGGPSDDR
jgi:hypothetical protein